MDEGRYNLVVGVTAIAGLVGVGLLMLMFGSGPLLIEEGYQVEVRLPSASGLTRDSRVRVNGIDIGRVTDVQLREPVVEGVSVMAMIRPGITLPEGVKPQVERPLIGGSPSLAFELPEAGERTSASLPTDGTAVVQGSTPGLTDMVAQQIEESLAEPMAEVEAVAASLRSLASEWEAVAVNLRELTSMRTPEAVDGGADVEANLSTLVIRLDDRLRESERVLDGLARYTEDEELRESIRSTVSSAERLTGSAERMMGRLEGTVDGAGEAVDRLAERYVAAADDLSAVLRQAERTLRIAEEGDGTLGKMLSDPSLYNNLDDAAEQLDAALTELRLLVEKWKREGVPIQF